MIMFVKDIDVLKSARKTVKDYVFTDWTLDIKRANDLAEYRRIEHLDDPPTYYHRKK